MYYVWTQYNNNNNNNNIMVVRVCPSPQRKDVHRRVEIRPRSPAKWQKFTYAALYLVSWGE